MLLLLPVPLPHRSHTARWGHCRLEGRGAAAGSRDSSGGCEAKGVAAAGWTPRRRGCCRLDAKEAAKAAAKQVEQQEWAAWEQELQEMAADPATAHIAARIRADVDAAAKAQQRG